MTYIPDYRGDEDKLRANDKSYWQGYKDAMEDAKNNLMSLIDNVDDEFLEDVFSDFDDYCDMSEKEIFLMIIENDEYYDDISFHNSNKPFYRLDKDK